MFNLIIHIKFLQGNFIIIISNNVGKVLFIKSSGNLGFKNSQKKTKDALSSVLTITFQYILNLETVKQVFLIIEGIPNTLYYKQINLKFLKFLRTHNILLFSLKTINKIAHGGCRRSK